jgi:hypothetical protein
MPDRYTFFDAVPVGRIFLSLDNPRHEPMETEAAVISKLCDLEDVYPLARDIAKHGLNPFDRFGLIQLSARKANASGATYYSVEGNRRICALKLLSDPDCAPADLRKGFEKLAADWKSPIATVAGVVLHNPADVILWLDRTHNGPQDGIGRKDWNAEQKQRFDGGSKNRAAQALLDYAEAERMITPEQRVGKLTTVQSGLHPVWLTPA